jgi:hypothetical protein
MNWYNVFYWLTVSDGIKSFFDVTSNIFTTLAIISLICVIVANIGKAVTISDKGTKNTEEDNIEPDVRGFDMFKKFSTRIFYPFLIISIITWFGYVATPS